MVAKGTAQTLMVSVSVALLLTLTAAVASAQLMPRTQPPAPEQLPDFERALQTWLTSELSLQGVQVAATRSDISVGFELAAQSREEIMSQITLVALHAAAGAPWANNLRISPSIAGYPAGVVTITVDAVRRLANAQLDDEGFFRTWKGELMPLMAEDPAELVAPLATGQGWSVGEVTTTDGLSALIAFGLPEVHARFPENHTAALTTVQTGAGQLQVAVIDVGDEAGAQALLAALATALGGTPPPQADATLNIPRTPPVKAKCNGGLLYVLSGPEAEATIAINTLVNPPTAPTLIADAGGDTTTGGGQPPAAGTGSAGNSIFADSFDGALTAWDASQVTAEVVDGALYITVQQDETLILRQPLPMDNIAIEFDALAETNGIQLSLMKSQNEHYVAALGMGGNSYTMLMDRPGGAVLKAVMAPLFTPRQWHHYRFTRQGSRIEVHRDGELIVAADDALQYSGEGMLVFSSQSARVGIDNVQASDLAQAGGTAIATGGGQPAGGGAATGGTTATTGGQDPPPAGLEPMALLADSAVKKAVICLGFDDRSGLRGVQDVFPEGTEKIVLYLEIEDARPNSEVQMTWFLNGKIIGRQPLLVSGTQRNISYLYASNRPTLWTGAYAVELRENERLVGRLTFRVE